MRIVLGILGVLIGLVSLMFVAMAIGDLAFGSKDGTAPSVLIGLLVFFLGTGCSGGWLVKWGLFTNPKAVPPVSEFEKEQRVLMLAGARGGRLTVADVALSCRLGVEDGKATLDRLVDTGVAMLHITDDGGFFYVFKDLQANPQSNPAGNAAASVHRPDTRMTLE